MRVIMIFAYFILYVLASPAHAIYNPASGEDDIIFIDDTQEVKMGHDLASHVDEKFGVLEDVDMQLRVNDIGQRIVKVCDRQDLVYSFVVLEGKDLEEEFRHNAFALPGGYVYIFGEMVKDAQSDDELAAILAHEVGHIVARHSVKKLQSSIGLSGLGLIGMLSPSDSHTKKKASYAIGQLMMEYSREAEFEADKLSVRYLEAAGFDPRAAVNFVDRMLDKQISGKIYEYHYFRTHPYTTERRAAMNKEIDGRVSFDDYINTPLGRSNAYW
ncbi:MAG: M48 family metalloprotease [Candidatus Omnitrophica bacterium]|nr:M48 family metalloprotease [Candidatus Omnitrophota bacterium]